jgi:hypothetical protein
MDYKDPKFGEWLDEQEAEADRVKRRKDYRERQATEMLAYVNQVRILIGRVGDENVEVDPSQVATLVEKIKDLRNKIRS